MVALPGAATHGSVLIACQRLRAVHERGVVAQGHFDVGGGPDLEVDCKPGRGAVRGVGDAACGGRERHGVSFASRLGRRSS